MPQYRVIRAIHGFIESSKAVVKIPPGEIVTVVHSWQKSGGLCSLVWKGQTLEAFRDDLLRNSVPEPKPEGE